MLFKHLCLSLATIIKMYDLVACDGHYEYTGNVFLVPEIEQPNGIEIDYNIIIQIKT